MSTNKVLTKTTELYSLSRDDLHTRLQTVALNLGNLEYQIRQIAEQKGAVESNFDGKRMGQGFAILARMLIPMAVIWGGMFLAAMMLGPIIVPRMEAGEIDENIVLAIFIGVFMSGIIIPIIIAKARQKKAFDIIDDNREYADNQLLILDQQQVQMLTDFELGLHKSGISISTIPDEYRASFILNTFCKYLRVEGAESWRDCIEMYKRDEQRKALEERYAQIASDVQSIKFNSRVTALYSGYIASKL